MKFIIQISDINDIETEIEKFEIDKKHYPLAKYNMIINNIYVSTNE